MNRTEEKKNDEKYTKAYAWHKSAKIIFKVFWRDIKRLVKSPITLVIFIGLLIFPCIYAWYNIAACMDPYANVKNVRVDVVNNDKAVAVSSAGDVCVGNTVASQITSKDNMSFQLVSEEEGMEDVKSGKAFATLVIPENFTSSILGIFNTSGDKESPTLKFYVNEKNNAIGTVVSNTAMTVMEGQINSSFVAAVSKAVGDLMNSVSAEYAQQATEMTGSIADNLNQTIQKIDSFNNSLNLADTTIADSRKTISECTNLLNEVQKEIELINKQSSATRTDLQTMLDDVNKLIEDDPQGLLVDLLREISTQLSTNIAYLGKLEGAILALSSQIDSSYTLLKNLDTSLGNLAEANASTEEALQLTKDTLKLATSKLAASSLSNGTEFLASLLSIDSNELSEFMKSPVKINTEKFYPVQNYGSGVAPFYTNLALWIAGFILLALMRVEVDRTGFKRLTSKQAYLARGLLFSLAGILTGAICCAVDLMIGIQCDNPVAFVIFGAFVGLVYLNIVYMLAATFKHIGKALAIVLIIIQISGSSGTFPIELMPNVYQILHPILPFSYGIHAMRELIAGMYGSYFFIDVLALLIFLAIAVFIGLYIRPLCLNLNWIFDKELSKNDLVICDEKDHAVTKNSFLTQSFLRLIKDPDMRKATVERLEEYETNCPRYRRKAILVMVLSPIVLFAIMAVLSSLMNVDVNVKLVMLFIWVLLLGIVAAVIIYIEYTHQRCTHQLAIIKAQDSGTSDRENSAIRDVTSMLDMDNTYAEEDDFSFMQRHNASQSSLRNARASRSNRVHSTHEHRKRKDPKKGSEADG